MNFIQKLIYNKNILLLSTLLIATAVNFSFANFSAEINNSVRNYLNGFLAEQRDTDIVIVEITDDDINKLGWPLKRNYYALLIDKLNKMNVKTIGLEVFLSPELSGQSIYNDLLIGMIKRKNNVVLGSVLMNLTESENQFEAEQLLTPAPKEEAKDLISGHLNFLAHDEIEIPLEVKTPSGTEPAFSAAIASLNGIEHLHGKTIALNITHPFEGFEKYSLISFLTSEEIPADKFNNKIVLVGVTAETLAKFVDVGLGRKIPGVAVHSYALENILNNNYLITDYRIYSLLLAFFVFGTFLLLNKSKALWIPFLLLFILYSGIYSIGGISMEFGFLAIAFFAVESVSRLLEYFESKFEVKNIVLAKSILERALKEKEAELEKLTNSLANSRSEETKELNEKIEELKNEVENLRTGKQDEEIATEDFSGVKNFEGMIYRSAVMDKVVKMIEKVAPSDATVLIYGESGSGKELVAKALHNLSKRKRGNFLAVNCAALTESLLESELFGYVKGAFTNAVADKKGLFEAANDGTIFLDEIGEISPSFQSKLLRVLQNGEFHKVGATVASFTNARIIAATNKNLEKLVKKNEFREDLFYRLNVITISLPPLRERKEDIPALAEFFLKKESDKLKFSKAALRQLENYNWNGNIRELESIVKRAAIFALGENREIIHLRDLPEILRRGIKDSIEEMILDSLRKKKFSHSSINETAEELGGISRTVVSENLRGMFFRYLAENDFSHRKAVRILSDTDDESVNEKLENKTGAYLKNVKKDVDKLKEEPFEKVKSTLNSKYKNLPQRYHRYLDEVIKHFMQEN